MKLEGHEGRSNWQNALSAARRSIPTATFSVSAVDVCYIPQRHVARTDSAPMRTMMSRVPPAKKRRVSIRSWLCGVCASATSAAMFVEVQQWRVKVL